MKSGGLVEWSLAKTCEVYDTLRAHLSGGTQLDKLPHPTLETLKTWTNNCDEAGFLSEAILWKNGIEQSPDCSEEEERPAKLASAVSSYTQEQIRVYPNPTKDILNIGYLVSGMSRRLSCIKLSLAPPAILALSGSEVSSWKHGGATPQKQAEMSPFLFLKR
ncbi:MAG: hypothetical protein KF734_19390 [Saprospiraceae bacterium]|nr:hypothetical protein [Saprospiraceae bacterium]